MVSATSPKKPLTARIFVPAAQDTAAWGLLGRDVQKGSDREAVWQTLQEWLGLRQGHPLPVALSPSHMCSRCALARGSCRVVDVGAEKIYEMRFSTYRRFCSPPGDVRR